jgi:DNA-binding transcriptional LysR family regulator
VRSAFGSRSGVWDFRLYRLQTDAGERIIGRYMADPLKWHLVSGAEEAGLDVHGRFSTNNVPMTLKLAERGYGIAALSTAIVCSACDLESVRRSKDWNFPFMPVYAVMTSRLLPARVRTFMTSSLTV